MKHNLPLFLAGMLLTVAGSGLCQPIITVQPQNQTNFVGTTVIFAVEATGFEPLVYQWQHAFDLLNFVNRPEGTNASLVITNLQTADAGLYRALVTNSQGTATSEVARLYVNLPPTLQFSSGAYTVSEGAGIVTVSVRRTGYLEPEVSVDYATVDGTAANGVKYTAVSGTLAYGAGETNKIITIPILNDGFVQGTRYFQIVLTNPANGAVLGSPGTAIVNITDNDKGLALEFASFRAIENEPHVLIGVVRGDDGDSAISVDVSTANGTALSGEDYSGFTNTLSFAAGERLKLVTIPILNDGSKEGNETFSVRLSNPTGGGVLSAPVAATVTLIDNDPGVQFTYPWSGEFASVAYAAHEYAGRVELVVTRGNDGLLEPFSVHYAARDITASNGLDYALAEGVLEFGSGEARRVLSIPIANEGSTEADERFQVLLSDPTGAIGLGVFTNTTVTIYDSTGWAPHGFSRIRAVPGGGMELSLAGGVPLRFRPYFDLYLLDTSVGLETWAPWMNAVRTNTAASAPLIQFNAIPGDAMRFFGTRPETLVTPREPPTGPYAVGILHRWVADPTRRNRYNVSTNSSMWMTVWYPATRPAGQLPARFVEEPIIRSAIASTWHDRVIPMSSYALLDASLPPGELRFPVILASHGVDALRIQNDERAENLASHGYVVVATDHRDNLGLVFPDGSFRSTPEGVTAVGMNNRVQDLRFMLDQVVAWSQDDPVFAGRLDLNNVGAMGFSWGGASAAEICRVDSRFRAAVLLDPGAFTSETLSQGLSVPSLTINSAGNGDLSVYNKSVSGSVWLQISSTTHESFTDIAFIISSYSTSSIWEADRTIDAYVLAFLNQHLKEQPVTFPLPGFPRVVNVRVK